MNQVNILFILMILCLLTSCYKVYDPHVEKAEKVLVVDGMITNQTEANHINITYAKSFNLSGKGLPVSAAIVYVNDDLGNSYIFTEKNNGEYISDSLQFTGIPGRTYRLHIITSDDEEYNSDPQRLFPAVFPDSVYAEFDNKEILDKITGLKVNTHGANMLTDFRNQTDTLHRFRFTSNLVTQYLYLVCPFGAKCDIYYCWKTDNANTSLNLTGEEYSQGYASIKKHAVCFLDDNLYCYAQPYVTRYWEEDSCFITVALPDYQSYMIHHRILYLKTYTLSNETYLYCKGLDEQLKSEAKLFDPIAVQLNGNIKCISNPEKKALGFFEAFSVSYSAYIVDFRNLRNSQPSIIKTPYILPPELKGCSINTAPSFWIFE